MAYKLIALDLDGTLLDDNAKLIKENEIAIKKAIENGVYVVLSSGRGAKSMSQFFHILGMDKNRSYASSFHGSNVYFTDNLEVIENFSFKKNYAMAIINELKKISDIGVMAYDEDGVLYAEEKNIYVKKYIEHVNMEPVFINDFNEIDKDFMKTFAIGEDEKLNDVKEYFDNKNLDNTKVFRSANFLLEFMNPNSNKGESLKYIAEKLNISIDETIGMGDNFNDMELMESAGLGVAVKNAVEPLKEKADYITENDNNNGAVAEVINKFILKDGQNV